MDWIGLDEATGGDEAAAANRSRCRNGRWRRERGGLTQRRGVANRLPGGGRFLTLELCDRCIRFPVVLVDRGLAGQLGGLGGMEAAAAPDG